MSNLTPNFTGGYCKLPTMVLKGTEFLSLYGRDDRNVYTTEVFATEEDWRIGRSQYILNGKRQITIGGSDAPVVAGLSSFKTRDQLADELSGKAEPEDISNKPVVKRGKDEEPFIRAQFAIEHPEYDVYDGTHIVFHSKAHPWMSASLDGILVEKSSGNVYILEIKACNWTNQWKGQYAPDHYFVQLLHQMAVTGFDGVYLHPRLFGVSAVTERNYFYTREQIADQMDALVEDERAFVESIAAGRQPSIRIPTEL